MLNVISQVVQFCCELVVSDFDKDFILEDVKKYYPKQDALKVYDFCMELKNNN